MTTNNAVGEDARKWVREHEKEIVERFAGDTYQPEENPISLFMAGSPGAGKTEFSKNLIKALESDRQLHKIVRIDPDDIRELLPGYTGNNSDQFQGACSLAVEKIHDYALKTGKNFILDGTLSKYEKAEDNIKRSLAKKRGVVIAYIYQEPSVAWEFTKRREAQEGRRIPKEAFVEQFFDSRKTANRLKQKFGDALLLYFFQKNLTNDGIIKIEPNIDNIDKCIKVEYTHDQLMKSLK